MTRAFSTMAAGLALAAAFGTSAAAERVSVLVFDASGSMWNRVEGDLSRIEVARDVMGDYFASRDGAVPLSVIAYGHNRRGDCGDIEIIAPMGRTAPGALESRLRGLMPRGMTPLTDSLALARGQIPATAEAADIILVTDGLETCGGDPCALAASLAAEGIEIRAHVVGFGLTRLEVEALSCITEQTGGMLFETNSGAELAEALRQVSVAEPAPEPAPAPEPEPQREAAFDIGERAEAGFVYTIRWNGDARNVDYMGFVPQGESRGVAGPSYGTIGGTSAVPNNPVTRTAPAEPGMYDLILVSARDGVIARQAVEVVAPHMGFEAIGSVEPGSRVRFAFRGPERAEERIVIARPGDPANAALGDWGHALHKNGVINLRVPDEPGEYEVRYLNRSRTEILFARRFGVGIPFADADLTTAADLAAQAAAATQGAPTQDDIAAVTATFRLPPDLPDSPVSWDAIPLDPDMSPEAWAPMETGHVISGAFEPGNWRVTARAPGETILTADVAIFPGQTNDFTLQFADTGEEDEAALMLNGDWRLLAIPPRDAPAGSPTDPIEMLRVSLAANAAATAYEGTFVPTEAMTGPQGAGVPGRLDSVTEEEGYIFLHFALPAVSPAPFIVSLAPQGEGFAGTMVSEPNSLPVVFWPLATPLPPMTDLQTLLYGAEDHGALIDETIPVQSMGCSQAICTVSHPAHGIEVQVPQGWLMHQVEGGTGAVSAQFTNGGDVLILLGGMDWNPDNGPCLDSAAGPICHWPDTTAEGRIAAAFIAANLRVLPGAVLDAAPAQGAAGGDAIVVTLTGTTQFGSGCFIKAELSKPSSSNFTLLAPVVATANGVELRSITDPEAPLEFEIFASDTYGASFQDMALLAPCEAIRLEFGAPICMFSGDAGPEARNCPHPVTFLPFGASQDDATPAGALPDDGAEPRFHSIDLGGMSGDAFLDFLSPRTGSE